MPPEEKGTPAPDMFGESTPVETPVVTTEEPKKEEGKVVEKKEEGKGEDIKDHPYVKELTKKLEDYSTNLSGQGKKIKDLEAKLGGKSEEGKEGKEDTSVIFKEIKTSKDLTADQKEEMTETEIKQFDEMAVLKGTINDLAKMVAGSAKQEDKGDGTIDFDVIDDLSVETKSLAMKLAGEDVDLANKIINEFNQFAGNDELTRSQLVERLEKSAKLVPEYKAPKEQPTKRGGVVGGIAGDKGKDPFGVDAIVEQASKGSTGTYSL